MSPHVRRLRSCRRATTLPPLCSSSSFVHRRPRAAPPYLVPPRNRTPCRLTASSGRPPSVATSCYGCAGRSRPLRRRRTLLCLFLAFDSKAASPHNARRPPSHTRSYDHIDCLITSPSNDPPLAGSRDFPLWLLMPHPCGPSPSSRPLACSPTPARSTSSRLPCNSSPPGCSSCFASLPPNSSWQQLVAALHGAPPHPFASPCSSSRPPMTPSSIPP